MDSTNASADDSAVAITPSPRPTRNRRKRNISYPGEADLTAHEKQKAVNMRNCQWRRYNRERDESNAQSNLVESLKKENNSLRNKNNNLKQMIRRLNNSLDGGDVGATLVAATSVIMPGTHEITRAKAIVEVIYNGEAFGKAGRAALEEYVALIMAQKYPPERLLHVMDTTITLSLTSISGLARADPSLQPGEKALIPGGDAVGRRMHQLNKYILSRIHFHYHRNGWDEVAQWDSEMSMRLFLHHTGLMPHAVAASTMWARPTAPPVLAYTFDGVGFTKGAVRKKGAVMGGWKAVDSRSVDSAGGLMFRDEDGNEENTQSSKTIFLTDFTSSPETKDTYMSAPFSTSFRLISRVRRHGLPCRGMEPWLWPIRPLTVWLMADKVGHQKATRMGGALHLGGADMPCYDCGVCKTNLGRYRTGEKRCDWCKKEENDKCPCTEIVTRAKAEEYRVELHKIIRIETAAGRINYKPPKRDGDRRNPVHSKRPTADAMQRIHEEDALDPSRWYEHRYLDDETDLYCAECKLSIDERTTNNDASHLLFDPTDESQQDEQRALVLEELGKRNVLSSLPTVGRPSDGEIKAVLVKRMEMVERVQHMRRVLLRHDNLYGTRLSMIGIDNPVHPEDCVTDLLHQLKNVVAKHLEVLLLQGWQKHAGDNLTQRQARVRWKKEVEAAMGQLIGKWEIPIDNGTIGKIATAKISDFSIVRDNFSVIVPIILSGHSAPYIARWVNCCNLMKETLVLCAKPGVCTVEDADAMQRKAYAHWKEWGPLAGNKRYSNYLHDLHCGHVRADMIKTGGLFRFQQQGTEKMMGMANRKYHNNSNKGGGHSNREGFLAQVGKWSGRHHFWLVGEAQKFFDRKAEDGGRAYNSLQPARPLCEQDRSTTFACI